MIPSLRHVDEAEMVRFGLLRAAVRQENAYRRAGAKCRRCQLHARRVLLRVADLERGEASLHRELLAHPFAAVTRDRVRDLVTDDRREPRVVTRDRQDAAVDHDLAAREAKRIDLLVLEDLELPLVVGASGRGGDSSSDARQDRKSTRLNSSHLVISYAVFCLKKKNNAVNMVSLCPWSTGSETK